MKNGIRSVMQLFVLVIVVLLSGCSEHREATSLNSKVDFEELVKGFKEMHDIDSRLYFFDLSSRVQAGQLVVSGRMDEDISKQVFLDYIKRETEVEVIDSIEILHNLNSALVNVSVCNVRAAPSHTSEMVTQHLMGYPVRVYRKNENGWLLCKGPDNYIGWIEQSSLTSWQPDWALENLAMVTAIESVCTYRDQVICDLVFGNLVYLEHSYRAGALVRMPDGRSGYVNHTDLVSLQALQEKDLDPTDNLQRALSFMGRPYLWGGTSPRGIDCSGFTRTVFLEDGVMLGRDASLQVLEGSQVDPGEHFSALRPGDLLFFGSLRADGTQHVTHVAIHIDKGRFVHASGLVKIESLNPEHEDFSLYRSETFLQARRIDTTHTHELMSMEDIFMSVPQPMDGDSKTMK